MGLFDDITGAFDTAVSGVSGLFSSGSTAGPDLGGLDFLGNIGSSFLPVNYPSQGNTPPMPVYQNTMAMAPTVVSLGRGLARFPQLGSAIMAMSQHFGKRFTPELIWRMVKMNGPGLVIGLIGAGAMNELAIWKSTHKGRRMNVANTKALRRSLRRLKGFDRLSHRVSAQLHRGGRRRSSTKTGSGSTQFVRQG
jgi:hypothetical protein